MPVASHVAVLASTTIGEIAGCEFHFVESDGAMRGGWN
jgi:hypothetical protein